MKKYTITLLLLLVSLQAYTVLAQNETTINKQDGFILDIPDISNPYFKWGLQTSNDADWWSLSSGINFKEYAIVYNKGEETNNFTVSKDDESVFVTEKGRDKVTVQIGLVGFRNANKKFKNIDINFLEQPSNISKKQQPLIDLLVDAVKHSDIESDDLSNIYVICDQASDNNDVLGYEKARCIIWYRGVNRLVSQEMKGSKEQQAIPKNYHYYYVQVSANEFAGRKALMKDLFGKLGELKKDKNALYHLYISNGIEPIIVYTNGDYEAAIKRLNLLEPRAPSIGSDRDLIWKDVGGQHNNSYMQKLAKQATTIDGKKYGQCYFHYYLSNDLKQTDDIYELVCKMFKPEDKQLDNVNVYIHTETGSGSELFYHPCELDLNTCEQSRNSCIK
ncbi:MAG: hypothetical protein ACPG5B_18040 [Chitinophagales bacterium]